MKRTIKLEIFMAFLLVFVVIFTVTVSITDEIISRYNESPYGWLNQNEIMKYEDIFYNIDNDTIPVYSLGDVAENADDLNSFYENMDIGTVFYEKKDMLSFNMLLSKCTYQSIGINKAAFISSAINRNTGLVSFEVNNYITDKRHSDFNPKLLGALSTQNNRIVCGEIHRIFGKIFLIAEVSTRCEYLEDIEVFSPVMYDDTVVEVFKIENFSELNEFLNDERFNNVNKTYYSIFPSKIIVIECALFMVLFLVVIFKSNALRRKDIDNGTKK